MARNRESKDSDIKFKDIFKNNGQSPDFTLFLSVLLLVIIGVGMVYSASSPEAIKKYGSSMYFAKKQAIFMFIGLISMIIFMNINYKIWKKFSFILFIISLVLCGLVIGPSLGVLKGVERNGAYRWLELSLGSFKFRFMPSDIMKITSIMLFSQILANKKNDIRKFFKGTVVAGGFIGLSILFIVKEDLGTALIIMGTLGSMFFIAGLNMVHVAMVSPLLVVVVNKLLEEEYRRKRLISFKDPFKYISDIGWQVSQSLYAIGSGGFFGVGLGLSNQKHSYISEAYNDFIFAIITEETGLVGATIVLVIYGVLIYRGVMIARFIDDDYGKFLAIGLTALIAIQTLIHVGVVTSSIPTTGVNLPFISYGGTSLVIMMSAMGILLNISRFIDTDKFDRS